MKKFITFVLTLSISFAFSQQKEEQTYAKLEEKSVASLYQKDEVRLNAGYLLFYGVEGAYERILTDDLGVGTSVLFVAYERLNEGMNFNVSPFVRYYLGKKPASGFFVEGFASVFNKNHIHYEYHYPNSSNVKDEKHTGFALGFGLGIKWIKSTSGFYIEVSGGVGREPRAEKDNDFSPFIGKGGLSIGLRF